MPNRLADARSPYLRSAQDQPVDWHEYGPEAFEKAEREGKPVLLDIGAVWCHWCHVMDHESYENDEVAALINELYVPVKVDRDERPDVDARYQKAVNALIGQGGWPLTAFLAGDGRVFFGGTYFPPRDMHGRPGFQRVLREVAEFYKEKPDAAKEQADRLAEALDRHVELGEPGDVTDAVPQEVVNHALAHFDPVHGGFGTAPKFPQVGVADLLMRRVTRTGSDAVKTVVTATLDGMADGGIHDHVGGGYHRYSTDAKWLVPHFEKMLYDNAGLLANHVHAYRLWSRPRDAHVVRGILRFLREVLQQPGGGFGGSQDADRHVGDDGDYFTWTLDEVRGALDTDEEVKVARLHFGVEEEGHMHHDHSRNVLHVEADVPDLAHALGKSEEEVGSLVETVRGKLLAARMARDPPFVDPTVYANWNGMAIAAVLEAAAVLEDDDTRTMALAALDRLLRDAWQDGQGFAHTLHDDAASGWGLLDDQVQMGWALLEAFVHTGEARYLAVATEVATLLEERFFDGKAFRDRAAESETPVLDRAEHPIGDSPTPSPNAVACRFLVRLSRLTAEARWLRLADTVLASFADIGKRYGIHGATYGLAVDERLHPVTSVELVGTDDATLPLRRAAVQRAEAGLVVTRKDAEDGVAAPAAIVCVGDRCLAPAGSAEDLATRLREL